MIRTLLLTILMIFVTTTIATSEEFPDGKSILKKVDKNIYSDAKKAKSRMIIYNRRGRKRELTMLSWMEGSKRSFSEYLSPEKEKGTKMLKLDKNLWTYTPRTDRIIHIAGHLLRQSVMGSDLSYEDSMEEVELADLYYAKVLKKEKIDGIDAWVLDLETSSDKSAYPKRKIWVDCERYLPLKEDRFGKSGKLLKTTKIMNYKKFGERWYPTRILYKDVLKSGKGTELIIDDIEFDTKIPEGIFSKQSLRK